MISGKSYSDLCNWIYCPRYSHKPIFNYHRASSKDLVFINGDYIEKFLSKLPIIRTKKFIFIIHNSDRSFDTQKLNRLTPHAIHIYAINTQTVSHPKLTTIPIGFVDNQLPFLSSFNPPVYERTIEIYMNFTIGTHIQKRSDCIEIFKNDSRVTHKQNRNIEEYYDDLCRSKYVLCPEGTGIDTHRVYESILCGAIPVVLRNSLAHLYETLPVCILDKWTDELYVPKNFIFKDNVKFYINLE